MGQPVHSMTGVGLATGPSEVGEVRVEIRTVNGRGFAAKLRLPSACSAFEAAVEELLRARIARGSVLAVVEVAQAGSTVVDAAAMREAAAALRALAAELQLDAPRLGDVLGAVAAARRGEPMTSRPLPAKLASLFERALTELQARRAAEGERTAAAILGDLAEHEVRAREVAARAPQLVEEHRRRLLQRVQEFAAQVGASIAPAAEFVREVAVFAERIDVAEELQRLTAHTEALRALLRQGGEVGKRLEFLLQELHRETNTLGAKSPDAAVAHAIVAMKANIERMKEQAANLQ